MYEEARRRQRWLEATGEVTAELLSASDPTEVLRLIANRARELTGADYTLIAVPNDPALGWRRRRSLSSRWRCAPGWIPTR